MPVVYSTYPVRDDDDDFSYIYLAQAYDDELGSSAVCRIKVVVIDDDDDDNDDDDDEEEEEEEDDDDDDDDDDD